MKRLVVLMSILLIVFGFVSVLDGAQKEKSQPAAEVKQADAAEGEEVVDANAVAEPNAVGAEAEELTEMEKELKDLNERSQGEIAEWMRDLTVDRTGLARAVQSQINAELYFLKRIATEEKAVKTKEAIDSLMKERERRSKQLLEQMQEERNKIRRQELQERREARRRSREDRRSREREPIRRRNRED